jgi:unsaturated rhamnogalacturonyl hydrolase
VTALDSSDARSNENWREGCDMVDHGRCAMRKMLVGHTTVHGTPMKSLETSSLAAAKRISEPRRLTLTSLSALIAVFFGATAASSAQSASWTVRVANAIAAQDAQNTAASLDQGTDLQFQGLDAAWYNTANGDYFRFAQKAVDGYLDANSSEPKTNALHRSLLAKQVLLLYRVTLNAKYYEVARQMDESMIKSCGEASSNSQAQDAKAEPSETTCAAQPFLAEYASVFHRPQDFATITRSFEQWGARIHRHSADAKAANRAPVWQVAWLAFALVDSLPNYPRDDAGSIQLISMLNHLTDHVIAQQDAETGLFNEKSAAGEAAKQPVSRVTECLLVYAIEKGVRLGYLPVRDEEPVRRAWNGIIDSAIQIGNNGTISFKKSAAARDSATAQSAPTETTVAESGALLLAATEADLAPTATRARGETVLLDAWYNSQQRKNAAGQLDLFHYKWSDWSDGGYALFGHIFESYGAVTETLDTAPTREKLSNAQFYIIASPDIPVKNPDPHYMTERDASEIAAWVEKGGVLAMMENDPPNADLAHLNLLADKFGIHFEDVLHHHILGEHVEDGRMPVAPDGLLFHQPHTLYVKDTCAISLGGHAVALFQDRGDVVMATAKYGRGTVFAAIDPWLYNEYTDGRKKPLVYNQFDNFAGGKEFVQWLLQQHPR